uniref:Uncharacterized protein n=1 Tax=Chrysemys picta bellii TaxID=8478 RepID=A0A8C3IT86_CHRPI
MPKMELYQVSAGSLDAWIAEHLQPSEEFQLQVKDTVRRICDFLKQTCGLFNLNSAPLCISNASVPWQGGSAGKGTALKNNSDADLVLFLSCFSSYQDQMENRAAVLDTVKQKLNRCRQTIAFSVDVEVPQPKEKVPPHPHASCCSSWELFPAAHGPFQDVLPPVQSWVLGTHQTLFISPLPPPCPRRLSLRTRSQNATLSA